MTFYRLKPLFREKIWGGHKFRDIYDMPVGNALIGEGWIASSLPGKEDNEVEGTGMSLSELYQQHRELFNTWTTDVIPIKVLLADCRESTSVQIHPDDSYANTEKSLGKPECAFFLQADEGAFGIYGHNAKSREEFAKMTKSGQFRELLREYPVHEGDFAYVPAGRIHATCSGTMILEISRNADLTYRVYDFGRVGIDGKPRKLDIDKTIDVVRIPDNESPFITPSIEERDGVIIQTYVDNPGEFSVHQLQVNNSGFFSLPEFSFWFIRSGEGRIDGKEVKAGEIYFSPCGQEKLKIDGKLAVITASYREK